MNNLPSFTFEKYTPPKKLSLRVGRRNIYFPVKFFLAGEMLVSGKLFQVRCRFIRRKEHPMNQLKV